MLLSACMASKQQGPRQATIRAIPSSQEGRPIGDDIPLPAHRVVRRVRRALLLAAALRAVSRMAAAIPSARCGPARRSTCPRSAVPDFSTARAFRSPTSAPRRTTRPRPAPPSRARHRRPPRGRLGRGGGAARRLADRAKIHLRSNVNLHLEKGATLLFSERPADYLPAVMIDLGRARVLQLLAAGLRLRVRNVAITGEGTLRGEAWTLARLVCAPASRTWTRWWRCTNWPTQQRAGRKSARWPRARPTCARSSSSSTAAGTCWSKTCSIVDSPFWVLHPYLCRDRRRSARVEIRAHGHNNDGVDPEMSQNVLIEDCVFDQGDDAISVKSGRDHDAWRLGMPVRKYRHAQLPSSRTATS